MSYIGLCLGRDCRFLSQELGHDINLHNLKSEAGNLVECKQCLLKARHVAPSDTVVLYNLGLYWESLCFNVFTRNLLMSNTMTCSVQSILSSGLKLLNYFSG